LAVWIFILKKNGANFQICAVCFNFCLKGKFISTQSQSAAARWVYITEYRKKNYAALSVRKCWVLSISPRRCHWAKIYLPFRQQSEFAMSVQPFWFSAKKTRRFLQSA
jgi:hypothetical protein